MDQHKHKCFTSDREHRSVLTLYQISRLKCTSGKKKHRRPSQCEEELMLSEGFLCASVSVDCGSWHRFQMLSPRWLTACGVYWRPVFMRLRWCTTWLNEVVWVFALTVGERFTFHPWAFISLFVSLEFLSCLFTAHLPQTDHVVVDLLNHSSLCYHSSLTLTPESYK